MYTIPATLAPLGTVSEAGALILKVLPPKRILQGADVLQLEATDNVLGDEDKITARSVSALVLVTGVPAPAPPLPEVSWVHGGLLFGVAHKYKF